MAAQILAAVAMAEERLRRQADYGRRTSLIPPPTEHPSRNRIRLAQALATLRATGELAPSVGQIADAHSPQIDDRTLRRHLHDEPELYELMPWIRRRSAK